jgi:hypothetical protein
VALVLALVAVPVVLSKSPRAATPPPVSPPPAATASSATAVPAVSVKNLPVQSRLRGHARDPFTQPKHKAAAKVATTPSAATKPATTPSSGTQTTTTSTSTTSTATGTGTGAGGAGSGSGTTTPTFPTAPRKPAPTGLSATQSYHVTLAITNSGGGLDTSDPLVRLSILPNDQEPLLVELGVLKGGHRVLFAVEPYASLSGPGKCTPGPVDCEILSLAPGQIEQLSSGAVDVAKFGVTEITADRHPSAAAADKARRVESAAGRRLLSQANLSALSLFAYRPSAGAIIDLRNLSVGGN